MNAPKILQKTFIDLLQKQKFKEAEKILLEDVYEVEDQMDNISEERYKDIERHWSAVETGEVINTPLSVLYLISEKIEFKAGSTLVDLGSGHGYPCITFSALNPEVNFMGIDIVHEKIKGAKKSAKRLGLRNADFVTQDLSDVTYKIPEADYYYIHNPFNDGVCEHVIQAIAQYASCKVISTNGRETRYLKEFGFKSFFEIKPYKIKVYGL